MTAPALAYIHRFEPGADPSRPPVLLLHGTGGDETDMAPLGREVAPGAALLSPRGKVLEGDMRRLPSAPELESRGAALNGLGDECDDLAHDCRGRLIQRRRHVCGIG